MSMSDSASISSTDSDWDFNTWITQNDLTAVKQIFLNHQMSSFVILSTAMQSETFGSFIGSISTQNPSYVHKIVAALQSLQQSNQIKRIRGSDEEFAVEDLIETKLTQLKELQQNISELHTKHKHFSEQTCTNIRKIETQITNKFMEIKRRTEQQKTNINNELSQFGDTLQHKISILHDLSQKIDAEMNFNRTKLAKVRELFADKNISRHTRKRHILQIGDNVQKLGLIQYNNVLSINGLYDLNQTKIELCIDDKSYAKILRHLKRFLKLKYECNLICQTETKTDECTINDLESVSEWNAQIESKDKIIHSLRETLTQKENVITSLRTQLKNAESGHKKEKELLAKEVQFKKKRIMEMSDRNERIINENRNVIELQSKCDTLNGILSEKDSAIAQLLSDSDYNKRALHGKVNKIQKMEKEIWDLKDTLTKNSTEGMEIQNWALQIQQIRTELNNERNKRRDEQKESKARINALEMNLKKAQMKCDGFKAKDSEVQKLRNECNKLRQKLSECHRNTNESKPKSAKKVKCVKVVNQMNSNGLNGGYAKIVKQSKINRKFLGEIMRYNGSNAREFVNAFCRKGGYGQVSVACNRVKNNKNDQIWCCRLEIVKIGLTQHYQSKQKKIAVNQCYQLLAQIIAKK